MDKSNTTESDCYTSSAVLVSMDYHDMTLQMLAASEVLPTQVARHRTEDWCLVTSHAHRLTAGCLEM